MRMLTDQKIVIATHNSGKLAEIRVLLDPFGIECVSAGDLKLLEPEETEATFEGNARLKAHFAAQASGLPALSDDSGISVEALNGAPGVFTADWAETPNGRDFSQAMTRVWEMLQLTSADQPYKATFNCTLCLAWPDGHDEVFSGKADGKLVWPMRGNHGFGFDPMFQPEGYALTFAEMLPTEKQPLTHRADAFSKMVANCIE